MGDYQRPLEAGSRDFGYFIPLRLAMLGRTEEAIAMLKEKEAVAPVQRGRMFMFSLRTLLEGDREASLQISEELLARDFMDPEGKYYLARQLARMNQAGRAIPLLETVVDGGYFCYPQMASDPWLDPIRGDVGFKRILHKAQALHNEAIEVFRADGGPGLLGQA